MVEDINKQSNKKVDKLIAHHDRLLRTKHFWYVVTASLVTVIILQFILPHDKAFIGTTIDDQSVGLKTQQEIVSALSSAYKDAVVVTDAPATKTSFKEIGIVIDQAGSAAKAVDYPVWQRFIPFSSIYHFMNKSYISNVSYNALPLSQWAKTVSAACYQAPQDASIVVTNDNTLAVVPSKTGTQCAEKDIIASLKATTLSTNLKIDAKQKVVQPKRTDKQVSVQINKIKTVIDQGISVNVLGVTTKADPKDIVSWLQFTDGVNGELVLDIDPDKLQPFIALVQRPVYIAPGTTIIYTTDGQETSRVNGAGGRGINTAALISNLRTQLQTLKTAPIDAEVVAIPPKQDIRRSYTNTSAGLQALLNDLVAEKGDMAIAVTELSGQGRSLSANGGKQYHPASTYKLVVAYSVIKKIEANQLKWDDQVEGQTVDQCLTKMIVNSDNTCAEAFANLLTWKVIQSDARSIGMVGTNLNDPDPVSTVNDQALYLKKLQNNELMKPENTTKLLSLMKAQVYRAGIPAGVSYPVADKVGFLTGLLHDSAIVYAPSGTYVISVYSNGGTWGDIADVASRIDSLIAH